MKTIKFLLIILIILMNNSMYSQVDRTKVPKEGKTPSFSLPKIQKTVLSNGLKIILVEYGKLPIIQMQFVFQSGAASDPIDKPGIANLTMRLLDAGTKKRTALQIADELSFVGTRFSASTGYDGSTVSVTTLKKYLEKTLELTSDILRNPTFPTGEFERIKKEVLTTFYNKKTDPRL